MPVMMVSAGYKLVGQSVFLAAALICLALGEREAFWAILGLVGGSVVPIAEKSK